MKFYSGFFEWPWFSKDDNVIFQVILKEHYGTLQIPTHFVEAETAEEGRVKLHALVDKLFEHKAHMEMLERVGAESKARHQQLVADLREVQSISIGEDPGSKPAPPAPAPAAPPPVQAKQSDLLDLCGEVLDDPASAKNEPF